MERNASITDLGRVLRLDSCRRQKGMCWGYDGFVLAHKDVNPGFDEKKPFIAVIDQDGVWQMHFENFGKFPKNEKALDDMYKAVAKSCKKGMELKCVGGATPGGLSGISKLQDYGFRKAFLPGDTNVYWGGELDRARLEKWLNSGRHDDEFLVRDGGGFVSPGEYDGEITPDNTKPRPFKMVRESARRAVKGSARQIVYWACMLDECFGKERFLCEDREGKNINRAEKWIRRNHPEAIGRKLENGTAITPRVLTQEIRNTVPNARMADCKFLVGVTRMYFDLQGDAREFQGKMNKLNKMLKIICTAHADEYDNDFNGASFDELDRKFSGAVKKELDSDREEIGKLQLIRNAAYRIVPIDSFDEAEKYGKYTSWCVTRYPGMYSSYTKNGLGRFYFCLRDGFEAVPEAKGEGCPMDAYGRSMIAISVNDDGSLNTCTCRWNHDNGANDSMMGTKEISKFLGVDFYKTFKPYGADELWKKILAARVPPRELDNDDAKFCRTFGCAAVYSSNDYYGGVVEFKKPIDGKIVTLPRIDRTTTYINNKFVTMKGGKFVESAPKTIQNVSQDIKGDLVIPYGVKRIGSRAFSNCSELKSVSIPGSVTSIGKQAFFSCYKLTSVTIPDGVTSIGEGMFRDCHKLADVSIPGGVTSIGPWAFSWCDGLTGVSIPGGVTSVGDNAFYGCKGLARIIFKGKNLKQVKAMKNYPFGIEDESVIRCEA